MQLWHKALFITFLLVSFPVKGAFAESISLTAHPQLNQARQSISTTTWVEHNQLTYSALDAIDFIAAAKQHGLEPNDYYYAELIKLSATPAEYQNEIHIYLLNGLLNLIDDLAVGRIEPEQVDDIWFIPKGSVDALDKLQQALISNHLKSSLNQLTPRLPEYYQLQQGLSRYQSYIDRGGWHPIPDMPLLRPDKKHAAIPALRARLTLEDATLQTPIHDPFLYSADLVEAVKRFQQQNNLKIDGIIGSETLAALNISATQRLQQIRLNLERLRWLPDDLGERYILVNIANYQLSAIDPAQPELTMRVIVGKTKRPTPSFKSEISHIVFNPYWNVPNKLARLDLLPKQQKNPDYFFLNNFKIFDKYNPSVEVDPYLVDWDSVSSRQFPYRLQQLPGEQNALGQMKFMFPNPWSIYLHDTASPNLFNEHKRNFSSGCIRVEQPEALAKFILNQPDAAELIEQRIASQKNQGQRIKHTLPIYAVYFTVWPSDNALSFSPDIYQRDQLIAKYL